MPFKKDERVLCTGGGDLRELTTGKTYLVLKDEEEGIFTDRPFVTVEDNDGKRTICHASRFKTIS